MGARQHVFNAPAACFAVAGVDDIFAPLLDSLEKSVGAGALTAREARRATRHVRLQQDAQEFLSLLLATAHAVRLSDGHEMRARERPR